MKMNPFSIICSVISMILIISIFSMISSANQANKIYNGYLTEYSKRVKINDSIKLSDIIASIKKNTTINNYVIYDMSDFLQYGSSHIGVYLSGKTDHPDLATGRYLSGNTSGAVVGNMYQNESSIKINDSEYKVIGVFEKTNSNIDTYKYYALSSDVECKDKILHIDSINKSAVDLIYSTLSNTYHVTLIEVEYSNWNSFFNVNELIIILLILALLLIIVANALKLYFMNRTANRRIEVYCLLGYTRGEILKQLMYKTMLTEIIVSLLIIVIGVLIKLLETKAVIFGSMSYMIIIDLSYISMILIRLRGYK